MNAPGFTKFDWPSVLLVRKSGTRLSRCLKFTDVPAEIESLVHVEAERPADKKGRSKIVSNPVAVESRRIIIAARVKDRRACGEANPYRSKARARPSAR